MNKYLITGATGFVGSYLIKCIFKQDESAFIVGISRTTKSFIKNDRYTHIYIDLNDKEKLIQLIEKNCFQYIIHLAAESSVGFSWQKPEISFKNNVNIYLNLLEAIRITKIKTKILSIGSSESYGKVEEAHIPLNETDLLNPISPYAVARVAQEMLSKVYIQGFGLEIILTRSFNHFGPGQDNRFVIPSFIDQIRKRKESRSNEPIYTGDLSIVRDFLDVRDVVNAYYLLLNNGKSGEIYNVCSGVGFSLVDIVSYLSAEFHYPIFTKINPDFIRPNDNPIIIGDNSKIIESVGWVMEYSLKSTLAEIVNSEI